MKRRSIREQSQGATYFAIAFTIPRIRAYVNRGTVRDGKRSGPRKSSSSAILSTVTLLLRSAEPRFFTFDVDFYLGSPCPYDRRDNGSRLPILVNAPWNTLPDRCIATQSNNDINHWYRIQCSVHDVMSHCSFSPVNRAIADYSNISWRCFSSFDMWTYYCGKLTSRWFKLQHEALILIFSDCSYNKYYARCRVCYACDNCRSCVL